MNWRISGEAAKLGGAELVVDHAEDEQKVKPSAELVKYARTAAETLASKLGGAKDVHVEIQGHETRGRGFTPGHVTVSVSRLDPKR